ncbi:hypothetical protein [Bradyrhizobium sp.]|uniref:hypothetical protein n=1 Tax=Bradyrhizobium sp. TaxID=376 RepID=UPI003C3E15FF
MTMMKALSVIAVLSTVLAGPVFARDAGHDHVRIHRGPAHHHAQGQYFRGAYNQWNDRLDLRENFGGRDRSRIGGEDPDLHPTAY